MATATKNKPRELADFEGYTTAKQKLAELESQRTVMKAKINGLPDTAAGREQDTISQKARDVLAGKRADSDQPTPVELVEKMKVLDKAVRFAENAVADEQRIAGAAVCEDHMPHRRELIADVVAKAVGLGEAYRRIVEQDNELRREGIIETLPTVNFAVWPLLGRALHLLAGSNGENLLSKLRRDNKGK